MRDALASQQVHDPGDPLRNYQFKDLLSSGMQGATIQGLPALLHERRAIATSMRHLHTPSMQAGRWRRCNRCAALQHMPVHDAVQVLDDSTDQKTRDLVDDKCLEWRERGVNCTCVRRTNRQGYKAGALKEVGMCCPLPPAPSACRMRGGALPGVP